VTGDASVTSSQKVLPPPNPKPGNTALLTFSMRLDASRVELCPSNAAHTWSAAASKRCSHPDISSDSLDCTTWLGRAPAV
jgi:hypothetical protein